MAQTGYTPISIYYSATAAAAPTAGNLVAGELAINTADGKLFYKDSAGVVQTIASKAGNINVSSFSGGTTGLTPNTASTGVVTLAGTLASANGGTGQTNITFPSSGGTAMISGNMPAFSAYPNATTTIGAGASVKIAFQVEEFDTASCFNNTASTVGSIPAYSFLPNVAGYYQVNGAMAISGVTAGECILYKNGSVIKGGNYNGVAGANSVVVLSALVYLNGTTDYIALYGYVDAATTNNTVAQNNFFQAVMVRGA
jgi:hypothetical protein